MKKVWKMAVSLAFMATVMFTGSLNVSAAGLKDVFDAKYYAETNPDLKAIWGYNDKALFNHYITCGLNEGRCGSPTFNVVEYRKAYPDLEALFGDDWDAYVDHYYTYGVTEGRNAGVIGTNNFTVNIFDMGNAAYTSDDAIAFSYTQQVVNIVNEERAKEGLPALTIQNDLTLAAEVRARELEQLFAHTRPDGRNCFTVLDDIGIPYSSVGENIAYGYTTPSNVMEGWMSSSGHRANIMNAGYKKIGVGFWQDECGRQYWVQIFVL